MADTSTPANATSSTPTTPGLWILMGMLLWVACVLAAAVASIGMTDQTYGQGTSSVFMAYLAYLPSMLLGLGGTSMILTGSIWLALRKASSSTSAGSNDDVTALLTSINERLLLSETAKRIAYRGKDIEVLRGTINQDIAKHQFDAALALIAELASTYGQLEEAETFRDQISVARTAEQEAKITTAIARLDDILARNQFDQADHELAKIQRLFPESERARTLTRRVVQAREQYKQELERHFLEASQRDDVDGAMDYLKEMDKYLTPDEAEPFREVARGVIGKKRDNLGVQFKMAVHDKEWLKAVRAGEKIIQDFPNSKMSNEVRDMLDLLRERAAATALQK